MNERPDVTSAAHTPSGLQAPPVEILLAAFNGGRFIAEQIDSLRQQSYRDFCVLMLDDGSEDDTPAFLDSLVREDPVRFRRIPDWPRRRGAAASFGRLLEASTAPRVMFCDQDDVWVPTKIERTLEEMDRAERDTGRDMPTAVFTDLQIVDEELCRISPSYWTYRNINPSRLALRQILTQNVMSGMTMMLNRPLVDLCLPIPSEALMHDYWVALTASAMGRLVYLPRATVLYRQHQHNVVGARGGWFSAITTRARQGIGVAREQFYLHVEQARVFLERYRPYLNARQIRLLEAFHTLGSQGFFQRRLTLLRHRTLKCGFLRNLGLMVIV